MRLRAQGVFLDLAGGRFGHLAKHHFARRFEACEVSFAERDDFFFGHRSALLEFDKRAGTLAPFRIGHGHHGGHQHSGMAVKHVFDFDAGDVFPARNNDVLAAILDLDVAVGIDHREVAAVKPAAMKSLLGRLGVAQIAFHHDVAAKHDFAQGLPIVRHFFQGV